MNFYFCCPKCGSAEQFIRPSEESANIGCAMLLFGVWLGALIYGDYLMRRVQCVKCSHLFQQPPIPSSPMAKFATVLQLLTILLMAAAIVFHLTPGLAEELLPPDVPILSGIEESIAAQPRGAAYLLAAILTVVILVTATAAMVGNRALRRQMAQQYQMKPPRTITEERSATAGARGDG